MRTCIKQMWVVFVVTAACQAQLLMAQDNTYLGSQSVTATAFSDPQAAETQASQQGVVCEAYAPGGQTPCYSLCSGRSLPLTCSDSPSYSVIGTFGFDSFQGYNDLIEGNFGAVTGVNFAMPIPGVRDRGFGWQLGTTYGVYDFDGRVVAHESTSQQQIFVTTGFFHKAQEGQRLSYGIVYDWMINDQWGLFATTPTLGQWRGQAEYALSNSNAVGVYACLRDRTSAQTIIDDPDVVLVSTRAFNQASVFWHHKFESGADSRLWFGVPEHLRYDGDGSLLDWIIGANIEVPLSERLALYGNVEYGHPSSGAGVEASAEQYYNIGAGVVWYFGGHARKSSINGNCWEPYMPMANNSNFLVEQGVEILP